MTNNNTIIKDDEDLETELKKGKKELAEATRGAENFLKEIYAKIDSTDLDYAEALFGDDDDALAETLAKMEKKD